MIQTPYLKRSRIREDNHDLAGASEDTWFVLNCDQVAPPMAREAIRRWARLGACVPKEVVESPAVRSLKLGDKFWLANTFNRSLEDLPIAVSLLEQILDASEIPTQLHDNAKHCLGLSYMGLGDCSDAAKMFRSEEQNIEDLSVADAFNYGMAIWGASGTIERAVFQRVVDLDRSNVRKDKVPNYLQCMMIAYWAAGDNATAMDYVERAQRAVGGFRGRTEFSCWRYLQVGAKSFEADLGEIRALIEDDGPRMPKFVSGTSNGASAA